MTYLPRVFVILPVHNRRKLTESFVKNLKSQIYEKIELVLVDDGSSDGTSMAISELYPSVHVLKGDGNLWWAGSIDMGLQFVKSRDPHPDDLILLINDDTEIQEDFILNGVHLIAQQPGRLLLAKSRNHQNNSFQEVGSKIFWPLFRISKAKNDEDINCAPSRGLLFQWNAYLRIGAWVPKILPHYCSDYEFTCRAIRKGFPILTSDLFCLKTDTSATGMEFIEANNSKEYFRKAFSMRSIRNPWTVSKFIWLSCPWYFKPIAWLKVWSGFVVRYLMFLFLGGRT